jgi:hypothetical protein
MVRSVVLVSKRVDEPCFGEMSVSSGKGIAFSTRVHFELVLLTTDPTARRKRRPNGLPKAESEIKGID